MVQRIDPHQGRVHQPGGRLRPREEDVLMGAYPLEGLDLTVNPKRQEVAGAHGDTVRNMIK